MADSRPPDSRLTDSRLPDARPPDSSLPDAGRESGDALGELLGELVARTVKQYRIAPRQAERIIRESLEANAALREVLAGGPSRDRLKRSAAFKRAASEAKRRVYYQLRSYQAQPPAEASHQSDMPPLLDALAGTASAAREAARRAVLQRHASTRERLAAAEAFYEQLFRRIEPPGRIVDIGCGVQPLMFPFSRPEASGIECYMALDNTRRDVDLVAAYGRGSQLDCLRACTWDLSDGWQPVLEQAGGSGFDLALMMKLVPVVRRRERRLLALLAETPARTWLVTGSRISMTRRVSIERRERRVLHEFVRAAGREVCGEFNAGEEFAWIVR